MVAISFMCAIYYNMIMAYTLYYVFVSFTSELPWQQCRPEWLQYGCVERQHMNATVRNKTGETILSPFPHLRIDHMIFVLD